MAIDRWGVFHLPKDSGKFRKRRWEMFIGEGRVPLWHTRPIHSQVPFTIICISNKIQYGGTTVVIEQNAKFL